MAENENGKENETEEFHEKEGQQECKVCLLFYTFRHEVAPLTVLLQFFPLFNIVCFM